jgi:hypothetical protein
MKDFHGECKKGPKYWDKRKLLIASVRQERSSHRQVVVAELD